MACVPQFPDQRTNIMGINLTSETSKSKRLYGAFRCNVTVCFALITSFTVEVNGNRQQQQEAGQYCLLPC